MSAETMKIAAKGMTAWALEVAQRQISKHDKERAKIADTWTAISQI
jgi:hypothetical protein